MRRIQKTRETFEPRQCILVSPRARQTGAHLIQAHAQTCVVNAAVHVAFLFSGNGAFEVSVDQPLQIGYGLRVGLLQESLLVPGVAVSWFKRDLPTTTLTGSSSASNGPISVTDTLALKDFSVKTSAWRITASKNLLLLGLAVGYGQDKFVGTTRVDNRYFIDIGMLYKVSRMLQLKANVRHEETRSNAPENNLTATVVQVGARVQY